MTKKAKPNVGELGLWLCAFGETGPPFGAPTVLPIFDAAAREFDLDIRYTKGAFSTDDHRQIKHPRDWLEKTIESQTRRARETDIGAVYTAYVVRRQVLQWSIASLAQADYWGKGKGAGEDPSFYFMIDLALAHNSGSVKSFIESVTHILLQDPRICYAFVNLAPRWHVPHPELYCGDLYTNISWEQFVEKDLWLYHRHSPLDRVRGVYWANIFGRAMTKRLSAAGFEQMFAWLAEEAPWNPVIIRDEQRGSLAVFLDDDPVEFAKNRDRGLMSDSASVRAGGALRAVLSKAGLL